MLLIDYSYTKTNSYIYIYIYQFKNNVRGSISSVKYMIGETVCYTYNTDNEPLEIWNFVKIICKEM